MIPRFLSAFAQWGTNPVLAWMVQALLYGTLLAVATWLFVRLFRKRLPSSIQAMLWCIVLIKFIVPIGPQWSLSLASFFESAWKTKPAVLPSNEIPMTDFTVLEALPQDAIATDGEPIQLGGISWLTVLLCCYGATVLLLMMRGLLAYRRLRKQCMLLPVADASVNKRVRLACEQLGVRRIPNAHVTTQDNAPFVLGGFKPLLVLSHRYLNNPDLLETVVVHEVAHLRRGDFIVRYIQWIAGSLLFYWPVVTWVNRQIDLARENACDEWALQVGKLSAADYARCLLDAVKHRANQTQAFQTVAFQPAAYHPACMAANPATIERRIDMILQSKGTRRGAAWVFAASVMVAIWGSFALAGGAENQQSADEKESANERELIEIEVVEAESDDAKLMIDAKYKTEQWFAEVRDRVRNIAAADTDDDGSVSNEEVIYYLATKTLADPESVIGAYPFADLNRDGDLSVEEALYFASGKRPRPATRGGEIAQANANGDTLAVSVSGEVGTAGETSNGELVIRRVIRERASNRMLEMHSIAGRRLWVLNHIETEPTAGELADAANTFDEYVAERYLEANPDSDSDGDGLLTLQERKNHQELVALQGMLSRFPEADLNADGVLSADERDELLSPANESRWKRQKELEIIERSRADR